VRGSRSIELARLKKKKEEEEEERKKNIWPVLRVLGLVLLQCFLVPLGVLLVMKTLEDEWYVVIKDYKLSVFDIFPQYESFFLYCHVLRVHAIPTLESTDSMIWVMEVSCRHGNLTHPSPLHPMSLHDEGSIVFSVFHCSSGSMYCCQHPPMSEKQAIE